MANKQLILANEIIIQVCFKHDISHVMLFKSGTRHIVQARREAMHRIRSELGMTYTAIAKLFEIKDHSTVIRAIKYYQDTVQHYNNNHA